MLTWILGPWGKLAGVLVLLSLLGLGYRWATNRAWEQGHTAGKVDGAADITKAKETEWKAKDEAFKVREVELNAQEAQAAQIRRNMKADLDRGLESVKKEFNAAQRANALIPADQLDSAIIARLESLKGAP